jgi:hypothetical protein
MKKLHIYLIFLVTIPCLADQITSDSPMIRYYVTLDNYAYNDYGMDFGDCPSIYSTLLVNDGARHIIDPNVFLGSGIDSESDGQPTFWADGDDVNGIPDEDGVYFPSVLFTDCTRDVNVVASCEGMLDAWFDFNADGDWSDPCEQIFASEPLNTGSNILTFIIPSDAVTADTYARFRFSTAGGLDPNGPATDGEVEDYMITIEECRWVPEWIICWRRPWKSGEYETWVQWNKPECWCSPIQCHGDADGLSTFGRPVGLSDLNILKAGFGKTFTELFDVPDGICADFDHEAPFGRPVALPDLNALKEYFGIPETQVPPDCWCGGWW